MRALNDVAPMSNAVLEGDASEERLSHISSSEIGNGNITRDESSLLKLTGSRADMIKKEVRE